MDGKRAGIHEVLKRFLVREAVRTSRGAMKSALPEVIPCKDLPVTQEPQEEGDFRPISLHPNFAPDGIQRSLVIANYFVSLFGGE